MLIQQFQIPTILISTASIKPSITPVAITTPIMPASINTSRNDCQLVSCHQLPSILSSDEFRFGQKKYPLHSKPRFQTRGYVVIKILTNWKLLIQNVFYRILIAFGDQSNLFSIRLVTIYDLVIVLLQLFDCAIRII